MVGALHHVVVHEIGLPLVGHRDQVLKGVVDEDDVVGLNDRLGQTVHGGVRLEAVAIDHLMGVRGDPVLLGK